MIKLMVFAAAAALASPAFADDARLHTFHCLEACPVGAPGNDDVIVREIYTLSAEPLTKMSVWVAYRVTPDTVGPSQTRNWTADPWLLPERTLEPDDYDGSNAALKVDRGHQAPLAAFSGTRFWSETNILSNITPQSSALNEGPWQQLEARETKLAKDAKIAVYVLTGPLFEKLMPPLPKADERHRVPSGYWKVVATEDGRLSAFLFGQDADRNAKYCAARVSLDEVELRARLELMPVHKGSYKSLDADLGCDAPAPALAPKPSAGPAQPNS
jgi:endonuclease G